MKILLVILVCLIWLIVDVVGVTRLINGEPTVQKMLKIALYYTLSDVILFALFLGDFMFFVSYAIVDFSNLDIGSIAIMGILKIITPIFPLLTIIYITKLDNIHKWVLYGKNCNEKEMLHLLQNFSEHPTKNSVNKITKKIKKLKHSKDLVPLANTLKENFKANNLEQARTISQNLIHIIEKNIS